MKASFEYVTDERDQIILMHPALADPYRLLWTLGGNVNASITLTQESLLGGMNGMLAEEVAAQRSHAQRAVRQHAPRMERRRSGGRSSLPGQAERDRIKELEDVMASMLCIRPTAAMRDALKNLYNNTPRWIAMSANLLH